MYVGQQDGAAEILPAGGMALSWLLAFFISVPAHSFEIIAHKGVHQEVRIEQDVIYDANHCPLAAHIWRNHFFIENTLPSIAEAFRLGADRVEIDVMSTKDGEVVLYHDSSLLCRTGINSKLKDLTFAELRKTDLSAEYRFHGLKTNPLRGKGRGLIVTLSQVLRTFPHQKFLINPKEDEEEALARMTNLIADRKELSFWGSDRAWKFLAKRGVSFTNRLSHLSLSEKCLGRYKRWGGFGVFPLECEGFDLVLSVKRLEDWNLWGGSLGILKMFHERERRIYILQPQDMTQVRRFHTLGFDGVITSRIDVLMPKK